jgi:lysophospholipase L1-like esterase
MPSGGFIYFKTNARDISLLLDRPCASDNINLTKIAKIGVDLYIDEKYSGTFVSNDKCEMDTVLPIRTKNKDNIVDIKLYLPLYEKLKINAIQLNDNAKVFPSELYKKNDLAIVFYGSSITQGASVSNPTLTYTSQLSRKLKKEVYNFGFSGMGLGQPEIIELITKLDASAFVLDFWANPNPKLYEEKLPYVIKTIRAFNKNVPIIVTSPIYNLHREKENLIKYDVGRSTVNEFIRKGDSNIYFHDFYKDFNSESSHLLIDGRHPNQGGVNLMFNSLYPMLNMILNKESIFNVKKNY